MRIGAQARWTSKYAGDMRIWGLGALRTQSPFIQSCKGGLTTTILIAVRAQKPDIQHQSKLLRPNLAKRLSRDVVMMYVLLCGDVARALPVQVYIFTIWWLYLVIRGSAGDSFLFDQGATFCVS